MSNRHLPAGQNIQGGSGVLGADMVGPGGPRRRQPPPFVPQSQYQQQHHHHQAVNHMYNNNYMNYGQQQYYGYPPQYQTGHYQNAQYHNAQYQGGQYQAAQFQNGQYQNAQYHNAGMPSPGAYMGYQQHYGRSPPVHQFVPMSGVSVPPSFPTRPAQQQSPALPTPYQPPAPASLPPQTPTSTHSSQIIPTSTPPVTQETEPAPPLLLLPPLSPHDNLHPFLSLLLLLFLPLFMFMFIFLFHRNHSVHLCHGTLTRMKSSLFELKGRGDGGSVSMRTVQMFPCRLLTNITLLQSRPVFPKPALPNLLSRPLHPRHQRLHRRLRQLLASLPRLLLLFSNDHAPTPPPALPQLRRTVLPHAPPLLPPLLFHRFLRQTLRMLSLHVLKSR
ncbi:hypothetical protein QX201_003684 [Fusarium graminearum]